MAKARKEGKDLLDVFVQLTLKATKGDLSKLPQLFNDLQFQQGMRAIIQGSKSLKEFYAELDDKKVTGSVLKDLNQILGDSQAKVDRLGNSWTKFTRALGETLVNAGATDFMDSISNHLDYAGAVNEGLIRQGVDSFWKRRMWGLTHGKEASDAMARSVGYVMPGDEELAKAVPDAYRILGRRPQRPHSRVTSDMMAHYDMPELPALPAGGVLGQAERRLGIAAPSASDFAAGAAQAKDSLAEGGKSAGQAVEDGGKKAGSALEAAAQAILRAASFLSRAGAAEGGLVAPSPNRVNADTGRAGGDLVSAP
jgi:hypothetical protein